MGGRNPSREPDRDAWAEEGAAIARELRMQEEDVLGRLAMDPARAADAMISLFEGTIDWMENPLPIEREMTVEEVAELWKESAARRARFWRSCDQLGAKIRDHPARR